MNRLEQPSLFFVSEIRVDITDENIYGDRFAFDKAIMDTFEFQDTQDLHKRDSDTNGLDVNIVLRCMQSIRGIVKHMM